MINNQVTKIFDLEERTLIFAKSILDLTKIIPRNTANFEYIGQIIRSSSSIGANYREANDALGKKDFIMRVKICRKEAKETFYWLNLILHNNPEMKANIMPLITESEELIKIFSRIITKML